MKFNEDIEILNSILQHFKERTEIKQMGDRKVTKNTVSVPVSVDNKNFTITVEMECD